MAYEQFKEKYQELLKMMFSYTPDQIGSRLYAEKLSTLCELFPEFEERINNE